MVSSHQQTAVPLPFSNLITSFHCTKSLATWHQVPKYNWLAASFHSLCLWKSSLSASACGC